MSNSGLTHHHYFTHAAQASSSDTKTTITRLLCGKNSDQTLPETLKNFGIRKLFGHFVFMTQTYSSPPPPRGNFLKVFSRVNFFVAQPKNEHHFKISQGGGKNILSRKLSENFKFHICHLKNLEKFRNRQMTFGIYFHIFS